MSDHKANPRRCSLYVVIAWMVFPWLSVAQRSAILPHDTLATVGSSVITARDLLLRLELMPFPGRQSKAAAETLKARALYALVGEKLLALAASRQGISEDENTGPMKRELENLFIRDELYKREIAAHAAPTRSEITEGMSRITKDIHVLSFLVRSERDGAVLSGKLRDAKPENVLQTIPRSSYTQVDSIVIRFGGPDTAYENTAYAIGKSKVSDVFYSDNVGWAVLYLLDRRTNQAVIKLSLSERQRRVEQMVRSRHEVELVGKYSFEVLKSRRARADSLVFTALADSISSLWKEDTDRFRSRGRFILTSDLVDLVMARLRPSLSSRMVTIEDGDLSLRQVLEMFRYLDFTSGVCEGDQFKVELNDAVKDLVARELLSREARRQGLHNARGVRADLQLWTDYWLARSLFYRIRDSVTVSDEDVIRHLSRNIGTFGSWYQVNVREVLTAGLLDIGKVLEELGRGRAFEELAKQYSLRSDWAMRGGESGYFDISERPEIGIRALLAQDSALIGPVKLTEGFSIFRILGKRSTKHARIGFDTLRTNIEQRLLTEKRKQVLDRFVAEQAREQRVAVRTDKLRRVAFTQTPMFTRRFIGFGGHMAASPLLMQLWDWVAQFNQPPSILP